MRLQALKQMLPYLDQFYNMANTSRLRVLDEIQSLEEEKELINQGQLILD